MGLLSEVLEEGYLVTLPSGKILRSKKMVRECPIQTGEQILIADLVVLDLVDFDLILGMDWLSKYYASV